MQQTKKSVSNINARPLVQSCTPFKGSNTFAEYINGVYVVFSYGYHFPLFAKIGEQWYKNSDKYSTSTSKQSTQLNPLTDCIHLNTVELKKIYS